MLVYRVKFEGGWNRSRLSLPNETSSNVTVAETPCWDCVIWIGKLFKSVAFQTVSSFCSPLFVITTLFLTVGWPFTVSSPSLVVCTSTFLDPLDGIGTEA